MTSWSLSSVKAFERCGLLARYKYVDRLPEIRSDAASRGVDFHRDIELYLTGERTSLPDNLSYYAGFLQELRKHEIYPEHTIKLSSQWEPVTEGPYWYKGVLDLKVLRRSEPKTEGTSGAECSIPPTEAIIYDWKTGKIYPEHEDQRTLYSVAVFAEHPTVLSVRAIHVYVDSRQLREKTFHRDQMHDLRKPWEDRANKFLNALKNSEWLIPNPGFHCRWCTYSRAKGGPCRF
jgi:hypothetical protein